MATGSEWLARQESPTDGRPSLRFLEPIPVTEIAREASLPEATVRQALCADPPIYHCFVPGRGHRTRSAPFALRMMREHAVLDWEPSVTGAIDLVFQALGYRPCLEAGTEAHIKALGANPGPSHLQPVRNNRDLLAARKRDGTWEFEGEAWTPLG